MSKQRHVEIIRELLDGPQENWMFHTRPKSIQERLHMLQSSGRIEVNFVSKPIPLPPSEHGLASPLPPKAWALIKELAPLLTVADARELLELADCAFSSPLDMDDYKSCIGKIRVLVKTAQPKETRNAPEKSRPSGHLEFEQVRAHYGNEFSAREYENLRGRLKTWEKKNEDRMRFRPTEGGRNRHAWPAEIVEQMSQQVRDSRRG